MRDMDIPGAQLARGRLCNGAQAELRAGESRISSPTAKARCRTGKEDTAFAAGKHQASCLATGEKARIAGHFPDLAEYAFGRIQNRKVDVGADVEDADLQRSVFVRIAKEGDNLLFLACIEGARVDFASGFLDFLDQRLKLGAVATPGEHREAL
jgi:hypothetical protein